MANFDLFYPKLAPFEGGYLSAKMAAENDDAGGETYKGIARNFNQDWEGWKIIDAWKAKYGIPRWNYKIKDPELDRLVKERAKKNYWDAHRLSEIKNQSVAEVLADWIFNSGAGNAVPPIQAFLGLTPDGVIGPKTIDAINKFDSSKVHEIIKQARIDFINTSKKLRKIKEQLLDRANSFFFQETK